MSTQGNFFDGKPIDVFKARFGGVEVDEEEAGFYEADGLLVQVMVTSMDGAAFSRTKTGGFARTNVLNIKDLRVITGEMRQQLIDMLGLSVPDQMSFSYTQPVTPTPDDSTEYAEDDDEVAYGDETSSPYDAMTGEVFDPTGVVGRVGITRDPALASFLKGA